MHTPWSIFIIHYVHTNTHTRTHTLVKRAVPCKFFLYSNFFFNSLKMQTEKWGTIVLFCIFLSCTHSVSPRPRGERLVTPTIRRYNQLIGTHKFSDPREIRVFFDQWHEICWCTARIAPRVRPDNVPSRLCEKKRSSRQIWLSIYAPFNMDHSLSSRGEVHFCVHVTGHLWNQV